MVNPEQRRNFVTKITRQSDARSMEQYRVTGHDDICEPRQRKLEEYAVSLIYELFPHIQVSKPDGDSLLV